MLERPFLTANPSSRRLALIVFLAIVLALTPASGFEIFLDFDRVERVKARERAGRPELGEALRSLSALRAEISELERLRKMPPLELYDHFLANPPANQTLRSTFQGFVKAPESDSKHREALGKTCQLHVSRAAFENQEKQKDLLVSLALREGEVVKALLYDFTFERTFHFDSSMPWTLPPLPETYAEEVLDELIVYGRLNSRKPRVTLDEHEKLTARWKEVNLKSARATVLRTLSAAKIERPVILGQPVTETEKAATKSAAIPSGNAPSAPPTAIPAAAGNPWAEKWTYFAAGAVLLILASRWALKGRSPKR